MANLFTGRASEKATIVDDDEEKEDEKDKSNKGEFKNTIKSRKAFQMAINDKAMPASIRRLSRVSNFVLLILFTLAISDYSIIFTQIRNTITNFEVIDYSYRRTAEI